MQSILDGVPGDVLKDEAHRINDRKHELERLLAGTHEQPALFTPAISDRFRQEVARLIDSLNSEEHRAEASELIRSLIDAIIITPCDDRDSPILDIRGDLAGILSMAANRDKAAVSADLSVFNPDQCEASVAGAGFEPATFRL